MSRQKIYAPHADDFVLKASKEYLRYLSQSWRRKDLRKPTHHNLFDRICFQWTVNYWARWESLISSPFGTIGRIFCMYMLTRSIAHLSFSITDLLNLWIPLYRSFPTSCWLLSRSVPRRRCAYRPSACLVFRFPGTLDFMHLCLHFLLLLYCISFTLPLMFSFSYFVHWPFSSAYLYTMFNKEL